MAEVKGGGFTPVVSVSERSSGNKHYVNVVVSVGDYKIKFDPLHVEGLIQQLRVIESGALQRRDELVQKARDTYAKENVP